MLKRLYVWYIKNGEDICLFSRTNGTPTKESPYYTFSIHLPYIVPYGEAKNIFGEKYIFSEISLSNKIEFSKGELSYITIKALGLGFTFIKQTGF